MLTATHRRILEEIGEGGATSERWQHVREFEELRSSGLLLFWPRNEAAPYGMYGDGKSGRWYLTLEGADVCGLDPPLLRLA
jgi:hypothetical protein